jgi:uncharacterized protein (TIGR04552 family)
MRRDILEIDDTLTGLRAMPPISLHDVEAVRLLLTGESVVDWQRLSFRSLAEVDAFLATHLLDPRDPRDVERLRYVFNEAVSYLEEQLHLKFPAEIRNPPDVRLVFLWASQWGGFRRTQILSCVVLKLMHIIHHMEAADLKFRLPYSEEQIFAIAHRRILMQARAMQDAGVPIIAFYGNRKSRSSMITKLLAKRESVAATIFDKLRFRVVVARPSDLTPTLAFLARELFPFNYLVPGQSHNNLLSFGRVLEHLSPEDRAEAVERGIEPPSDEGPRNEFSGATFRIINWIVDYPVQVDESVPDRFLFELGRVVYVNVEFQLLDQETARSNEEGENAHTLYKIRQYRKVAARLKRGAATRRE